MTYAADIPLWAALLIGFFLLLGSTITLIGCIGLVRFKSFYERTHMLAMGASLGMSAIIAASVIFFTILEAHLMLYTVLLSVFVTITTPVTFMVLTQAAIYRDRAEESSGTS